MAPATHLFRMPRREDVVRRLLRPDLELAGIEYRDAAGRYADFHALRHTFVSNLASPTVHPKTAQSLARHSTITLTMDRYTHSFSGDEAAALATLPDVTTPLPDSMRATGTDDACPPASNSADCLAQSGRRESISGGADGHSGDRHASNAARAETSATPEEIAPSAPICNNATHPRWGGRAVECTGLENRRGLRVTAGSNPAPTAFFVRERAIRLTTRPVRGESGRARGATPGAVSVHAPGR